MNQHAVYQRLQKPPTVFPHASVFKRERFETRVSVFKTRVFAHLRGRQQLVLKRPDRRITIATTLLPIAARSRDLKMTGRQRDRSQNRLYIC